MDEAEGGGGDGEVSAGGRESDAVGKGDPEGGKGVRERIVVRVRLGVVDGTGPGPGLGLVDRDVGDPAQRKSSDGFDEWKDVPDRVRETTRQEVIVAHIKTRRGRQRDRIRGHEVP